MSHVTSNTSPCMSLHIFIPALSHVCPFPLSQRDVVHFLSKHYFISAILIAKGAIQLLRITVGGGRVSDFQKKALRRCYYHYEGVGGEFPEKSVT